MHARSLLGTAERAVDWVKKRVNCVPSADTLADLGLIVRLFGCGHSRDGHRVALLPKHRAAPMPMTLFAPHRQPV